MTPQLAPCPEDPRYWAIDSQPTLLLGGSVEDNLFQIPNLEEHLDRLVACGGNYIRCTLSSRDPGDVWFAAQDTDGQYDLDRLEGPYWEKLADLFRLCEERRIVAQVEIFDRFDYAREPWLDNPFNPANNRNYTETETGLAPTYPEHPGQKQNPFFRTVPALENNECLLRYQEAFVRRLLELSLPRSLVLYCISNETNEDPAWGAYWALFLRQRATEAGQTIYLTEMWDAWDLTADEHRATLDHPELYDYLDASQNNQQQHFTHWQNLQRYREIAASARPLCPINTVKIYGANEGRFGTDRDAVERFWRNLLGGVAATRFHRPPAGLGLSEIAQPHLRSVRLLEEAGFVFPSGEVEPPIPGSSRNEVYARRDRDDRILLFFPDGGHVTLRINTPAQYMLHWLRPDQALWEGSPQPIALPERVATPERSGYWVALLSPA